MFAAKALVAGVLTIGGGSAAISTLLNSMNPAPVHKAGMTDKFKGMESYDSLTISTEQAILKDAGEGMELPDLKAKFPRINPTKIEQLWAKSAGLDLARM